MKWNRKTSFERFPESLVIQSRYSSFLLAAVISIQGYRDTDSLYTTKDTEDMERSIQGICREGYRGYVEKDTGDM